jgi:hypothetical protein
LTSVPALLALAALAATVGLACGGAEANDARRSTQKVAAAQARLVTVTGGLAEPVALAAAPRELVDPVCGMSVVVGPETPTAGGHAFCGPDCRDAWLAHAS